MNARRIVAGSNDQGRADVFADGVPPRRVTIEAMPGFEAALLWSTPAAPGVGNGAPLDATAQDGFIPAPGQTRLVRVTLPPDSVMTGAQFDAAAFGEELARKLPDFAARFESDALGSYRTDSIDYGVVLQGEVVLAFDDGRQVALKPHDVLVQHGERHAWRNPGTQPAVLLFVLIGAQRVEARSEPVDAPSPPAPVAAREQGSEGAVRTVRVARKTMEALDICSFELVDPDGATLPAFSAGSHVDVHLGDGLVRQYSLCNDPEENHRYMIAVLRDAASRGGSAAMHALREGDLLRIGEPKNHFPLAHAAAHSVLLAGGIGITPILCMAERLANTGASFELHYCARSVERMAFSERIGASRFAEHSHLHFDDGPDAQKLDLAALLGTAPADTHLYVCGPSGFMDWVLDGARTAGWPDERLHREYFTAAAVDTSADGSFEVQIASSGAVVRVGAQETVVTALARAGIEVPTSCEQGVCGTCLTRVLEGEPEHRDLYLTPDEQAAGDQFTPCCSRARSARLVLDL